ncbi:MAG: hypothetical protein F6K23_26390 [Okeania sp. SIO2C9]|uniref:P-loop NTPase fold protein n=1 Tax=Okeania sp. SIO2C9 TaxID=2607791 RepID=UPI0013BF5CCD|nr:P-loop NTPase fold protein [Okeania sp. SIO2C9]NEQ76259.1 hypothetical protein [Okeania sp. SIO2C9]
MTESTDKSNKIITVGDQATTKDELGFTPYVIAMAEFLTNENTKPPLTISIEGEWGSGKSSFMKQLEKEILKKSEELDKKDLAEVWQKIKEDQIIFSNLSDIGKFIKLGLKQKTQTVWFNAWRHEKSESLWATFALSFLEELSKNRNIPDFFYNLYSRFQLFIYRLNFKDKPFKAIQTLVMVSLISSITVAIPIVYWKFGFEGVYQLSENLADTLKSDSKEEDKSQKEEAETTNNETKENNDRDSESTNKEDANNLSLNILLQLVGISSSAAGIGKLFGIIKDLIGDEKMDLTLYLESPDYEKEAAFIEEFHEDFSKIVGAYVGRDEKIYVFIDDLDRCELGKAADLLQGINMMIYDDQNLIFILGMDREKVAASITFKQKDVIPFLASIAKENQEWENRNDRSIKQVDYGFSFLEKFVQLSFSVPESSPNTLNNLLEKVSGSEIKIETDKKKYFFWIPYSFIAKIAKIKIFDIYKKFKELAGKIFNRLFSPKEEAELEQSLKLLLEKILQETEFFYPELPIFPVIEKDLEPENLAILMEIVAPFFDNNPRRLKQYVNALKLKTYIAYYSIGVTFDEKQAITIEQMGKFTALTLKYPRLLVELKNNNQLLAELEKYAIDQSSELNNSIMPLKDKGNANYWINNYPKIQQLLSSKMKSNNNDKKYIFQNGEVKKLLQVSQQGISPKYFKLRELLAAGKWKEANDETFDLILQANKIKKYLSVYRRETIVGWVTGALVGAVVGVRVAIWRGLLEVSVLILGVAVVGGLLSALIEKAEGVKRVKKAKMEVEFSESLPSGILAGAVSGFLVGYGAAAGVALIVRVIVAGVGVVVSAAIGGIVAGVGVAVSGVKLMYRFPLLRLSSSDFKYLQYSKAIENFLSDELRTIDQLWVKYSGGKFGFSVQKKIFRNQDKTKDSQIEDLNNFCESLGWQKQEERLLHKDLDLELDGVLPCLWTAEIPSMETKQKKEQKNLLIIDINSDKGIKEKVLKLYFDILSKDL